MPGGTAGSSALLDTASPVLSFCAVPLWLRGYLVAYPLAKQFEPASAQRLVGLVALPGECPDVQRRHHHLVPDPLSLGVGNDLSVAAEDDRRTGVVRLVRMVPGTQVHVPSTAGQALALRSRVVYH